MKRIRPIWAIVAVVCAAAVLASVVASVATGGGWWVKARGHFGNGVASRFIIANGGVRYAKLTWVPGASNSPNLQKFFPQQAPPAWIPRMWFAKGNRELVVPFWTVGAAALAGFVFAWRRARRAPRGHCPMCSYNLVGLSSDVCPECGTKSARRSEGTPT